VTSVVSLCVFIFFGWYSGEFTTEIYDLETGKITIRGSRKLDEQRKLLKFGNYSFEKRFGKFGIVRMLPHRTCLLAFLTDVSVHIFIKTSGPPHR
jgi:hypothetical protein